MSTLTDHDLLRLRLLADGVYVERSAQDAWRDRFSGPLTLAEYATTGGISLILPGMRYVNAPLLATEEAENQARLRYVDDEFVVTFRRRDIPVGVVPVAGFHHRELIDRLDGRIRPMSTYGVTHTDRCRVSPIAGCAWKCQFCEIPFELEYRKKHVEDLLEVVMAAWADPVAPARHVLVSGGTPRGGRTDANDEEWIDSVFAELAARSPLPVDVMMAPRRDDQHPERLRKAGVNALSINLEVSSPARARALMPQKAQLGRARTLDYIERAVESFGVGYVQSLMVVGSAVEPLESTLEGVRELVNRGCVPVLSPFRPHPATPMGRLRATTFDEMVALYLATLEICESSNTGVLPGPQCVPCHHNVVAAPLEHDFYDFPRQEPDSSWLAC